MPTDVQVNNLIINKLSKAQYDSISQPSDTELYLIPDEIDSIPTANSTNTVTSGGVKLALDAKQDAITSTNKLDYSLIDNTPIIPTAVTESTVSGWGFTKNSGTYSKPSGGIPDTDLASAVQTSLGKADTALQSYTETDPVFSASAAAGITASDITNWNGKTSNTGTVTGVKINGTTKNPTSGVVDLGTVLTSYTETDPTVPSWAKAASKPTYTASEVGALPDTTSIPTESTVSGWGFTKNTGTVTGVKINGTTKTPTSGTVDLGTVLTSETALSKGTTIGSGNAVTDISVSGHQITLTKGSTFLTSETSLSKGTTTGSGNAVTDISVSGHQITLTKGTTFLTSHQDISGKANLSGAAFTGTVTGTSSGNTAQFRNVTISSSEPTASDGNNGDIWIVI